MDLNEERKVIQNGGFQIIRITKGDSVKSKEYTNIFAKVRLKREENLREIGVHTILRHHVQSAG